MGTRRCPLEVEPILRPNLVPTRMRARKWTCGGATKKGARERKSSLSPMITVCLSPLISKAPRRTESQLVGGVLGHSFLDAPGATDRRQSL
jgi:hypothetical protein